ncbi:MAG: asparaginase [Bellilinea sp.]
MPPSPYAPLVEVTRGPVVESVHSGALAVVDAQGKLIASAGDPNLVTYLRSSSKPLQVLPLLERGGVQAFNLSDKEIALMCASHSGTDEHYATVTALQAKIGISESDLLCGVHAPTHTATAEAMRQRDEAFTANRHNCSGKHTGFLAHAVLRSETKEDYINPNHPIQRTITQTFAEMIEFPREKIAIGVDGCSAPVFAVPLFNAALGFARLCDPTGLAPARAKACQTITRAMTAYPFMVAGPERFDTLAMEIGGGRFFCKGGAEGYQAIGILPGALGPGSPALGITYKVADGDVNGRARPVIGVEILRQLGLVTAADIAGPLAHLAARPVTNWREIKVGEMRPVFHLDWSALSAWVRGV